MAYGPQDAPCCPNCGAADLRTLKATAWWGERNYLVACNVCRYQFQTKAQEVEIGASYQILKCKECGGGLMVYRTYGCVRYLKCDCCSRTLSLGETVVKA